MLGAEKATPWLPQNALIDGVITAMLDRVVTAWGEKWLPDGGASLGQAALQGDLAPARPLPTGMKIDASRAERQSLGCSVLGENGEPSIKPTDRAVLDQLADAALQDLDTELRKELGAGDGDDTLCLSFTIEAQGRLLATIGVGRNQAIALRRKAAPTRRVGGKIESPIVALQKEKLKLKAFLGTGTIELAEVDSLAVGDVLVLDQRIDDLVPMLSGQQKLPGLACAIEEENGQIVLRVKKSGY